jgi:hypothetical protein
MSSTHRHLLLDFFWQVISGPSCIYTGLFTRGVFLNFYFAATNNTNVSNYKIKCVISFKLEIKVSKVVRNVRLADNLYLIKIQQINLTN